MTFGVYFQFLNCYNLFRIAIVFFYLTNLKKYHKLDVYFVFRQKKSTMIKRGKKSCKLSELKVNIGETKLLFNPKNNQNFEGKNI